MLSAEANYLLGMHVPLPEPVRRWRTDRSSWAERMFTGRLKNRTIYADDLLMRHPEGRDVHQRARLRVGRAFRRDVLRRTEDARTAGLHDALARGPRGVRGSAITLRSPAASTVPSTELSASLLTTSMLVNGPVASACAPENVTVGLNAGGSITLRWKAKNASPTSGAVFSVSRRIGSEGAYASIGPAQPSPRGKKARGSTSMPH